MSIRSMLLEDYLKQQGHTRGLFKAICETNARDVHKLIIEEMTNSKGILAVKSLTGKDIPNGFNLWWNDATKDFPILFRKKDNQIKAVDNYHLKHFMSSVIKNVLLDGPYDNKTKSNMLVYIYYYHKFYNHYSKLNINFLKEGVVNQMANTIQLLIDKEDTTYSKYDIDDILDKLRMRLNIERAFADETSGVNINIRR